MEQTLHTLSPASRWAFLRRGNRLRLPFLGASTAARRRPLLGSVPSLPSVEVPFRVAVWLGCGRVSARWYSLDVTSSYGRLALSKGHSRCCRRASSNQRKAQADHCGFPGKEDCFSVLSQVPPELPACWPALQVRTCQPPRSYEPMP